VDRVLLGHGSGGRMMHELISRHFAPAFEISALADAAVLGRADGGRLAFTTDSYVVSPLFFPGGNIGDLAINGTVNDLAVSGARPLYLSAGFILEEGLPMGDLERVVSAMAAAARKAGVKVVAGDTKVVDKGKGDGIFINTSGVGVVPDGVELSPSRIRAGDRVIISGPIGGHGVAVMAERNGLCFDPPVLSDTAPLNGLVEAMLRDAGGLRAMRDATRGGLATVLKEFAQESGLCITLEEEAIPVEPGVRGACELLGLDPLYVANEGVLVAVVSADMSEYLVELMRGHPLARGCSLVGGVEPSPGRTVLLRTGVGGRRMIDMLEGEQLPRIC
jgi:hydrogenase expression/formation protein HypE